MIVAGRCCSRVFRPCVRGNTVVGGCVAQELSRAAGSSVVGGGGGGGVVDCVVRSALRSCKTGALFCIR